MRNIFQIAWLGFLTSVASAQAATITDARVREVVSWLAADERNGRASGSPELAAAGDWLAQRFQKAGLKPVCDGSFFHEFAIAANRVDSDAVSLKLSNLAKGKSESDELELVAGRDVRQWLPTDGRKGEQSCTVAPLGDPVLRRLMSVQSARRPIIIEVAEDHPFWIQAAGKHTVLEQRRKAARPVFLVRAGLLPDVSRNANIEWTANWAVAASEPLAVNQRNVVGLLPARQGSDRGDECIVVSAHYDHIGIGVAIDGDMINNGADDDATGTTAVVLLAEAMAKMAPPRRNILFVCFAAEERGLLGSAAFCDKPPVPLAEVVANLNIEMIGRPAEGNEGKAWVTGSKLSDFASICDAAMSKSRSALVAFPLSDKLFQQSDNFSFVGKGIVAHSISAGSLHPDYHQPSDEVEKLDIPHMTKIIRGLLDVTIEFANRDQPPAWNQQGEAFLKQLQR